VPVGNIVVGGCGTTITTSGTTKTIKANMTGGCGCAAVTVAVGAAGTYVASITLKYYPGGSTYASDPWSQFIIITNLTTSCSTVLPISLESFTGKCTGNKKVLRWVTSSETNNKYFTIEQSKNGTDFVELAKVNGKGTSLVRNTYEYSFSEENSGYNYYRLKQTDMNGVSMTFSAIYLSCIDKIGAVKLYPNPAHKSIKLEFESADEGSYEVNIVDIAGRVVRSFPFNAKQDRNEIELNIEDLSNGLYNIIIADGEGLARPQTLKFIKSNE
ncbi:MAG: T9SS type A sorting domain-containing protein, partial [Bacteroidia bacterium]